MRVSGKRERSSSHSRTDSTLLPASSVPVAMASSSVIPALSVCLCALVLLLYCSPAEAQADLALDCCLTVSNKSIPRQVLLTYRKQFKVDGCPRDAVIFMTRNGLKLCAPIAAQQKWVQENMTFLDNRLKKCKQTKFSGKRCHALKNLAI